jgi:FIMAH domain
MRKKSRGGPRTITRLVLAMAIAASVATAMFAGAPPNLLDDNRGDGLLAGIESAAFNLAINVAGFIVDPLTFTYPPVVVSGRVLEHPKIHNLYLDDDWNANNPDAPTKEQIDAFTQELASSGYLSAAAQYGVGSAEFTGSHERSIVCAPLQPVFDHAEFVEVMAWVTCMVGFNPIPAPGVFPPLSGVPSPDNDSVYVVYLPRSVQILENPCSSGIKGYHFFGAAPDFDIILPVSQTFAFVVVPTACANGATPQEILNSITNAATHEIVEAATDPLVGTGWINNSIVTDVHGNFFEQLIGSLSNIPSDLKAGEAADICEASGTMTGPPAFQHPTPAIPIPTANPLLGGSFLVAAYWSNQQNACAPFVPKTTLSLGSPSFPPGFVTSSTVLTINAVDGGSGLGVASISFRVYPEGTTPPAFTTVAAPATFSLSGSDGRYTVDMFATGNNGMVEVSHSSTVTLDNSAPVITITSPTATEYPHSATLTLNYSATDGTGSGVASINGSLDGSSTLAGHGLDSGQTFSLLLELALGPHSFRVDSADHVTNASTKAVTFTIVVTAESIKQDVAIFVAAGKIWDPGLATALLSKLNSAAEARAKGNCNQAANIYESFINQLQAQSGVGVDPTAAAIMIADAQYLIAHCP